MASIDLQALTDAVAAACEVTQSLEPTNVLSCTAADTLFVSALDLAPAECSALANVNAALMALNESQRAKVAAKASASLHSLALVYGRLSGFVYMNVTRDILFCSHDGAIKTTVIRMRDMIDGNFEKDLFCF